MPHDAAGGDMKTDKIRSALGTLGFTHDVSGAAAELKALEESHEWMARALLEQGETRGGHWHTRECWSADRGCILECQGAVSALRKAGLL